MLCALRNTYSATRVERAPASQSCIYLHQKTLHQAPYYHIRIFPCLMRLAGWASPDLSSRTWITRSLGASPSSTSRTPRCRRLIPITATLNQSEDYSER